MAADPQASRDELRVVVEQLALERYGESATGASVGQRAQQANDCEFLLAWSRYLEADRDFAREEMPWLTPERQSDPRGSLRRIREICARCEDLYPAMQAVLAMHPNVSRDILAAATKKFRRDLDLLSVEDITGLLVAAWNGGQQGFDAVLRTRKGSERKVAALPWAGAHIDG